MGIPRRQKPARMTHPQATAALASHDPERWPRMPRNRGLASSGILASHAPEWWPLMNRNIHNGPTDTRAPALGLTSSHVFGSVKARPFSVAYTLRLLLRRVSQSLHFTRLDLRRVVVTTEHPASVRTTLTTITRHTSAIQTVTLLKPSAGKQRPNNSFKPRPLRGLV